MKLDNFFHEDDEVARKNYRIVILTVIISVVFVLYALRLFSLQIVNGNEYRLNADRNSSRQTTIPAQRGEIFDRNANLPLVVNIDSFAVDIIPGDIPNGYYDTVAMRLADFLGMSKSEIDEKIPRSEILNHSYTAYEIQRNVPFTVITEIAENKTDLPGV
ncbi:MAG: penicillin-binding protein 2, partial [Spirochaetales bacterium]|nr:penicillin-binding protein 2 [Spirochaetales bacterium]